MDSLRKLSNHYQVKLISLAAKERTSKKKINKELERAKNEYSKHKSVVDDLEARKSDIERKLEVASGECAGARKKMLGLHKTIQHMDISNASDAVFYNDDYGDVGYVIGDKEYHLSINEDGEMSIVPMLTHRRNRKIKNQEEIKSEEAPVEGEDSSDVGFINDLSQLYSDLTK